MADNKRHNASGKTPVATPNVGSSGMVSLEAALVGAIGARIRLTTTLTPPTTIEGTLFTACPLTNLLALSPISPSTTTHILPLSSIHSFTLLAPPPIHQPHPLTPLPTNSLLTRAQNAVTKLQQEAKKRNKNVSKEAQEIFDGLSRTLPARWEGKDIVVLDAVVVGAPYRGEDCKGVSGAQAEMVRRVRKVLENERKRLADRERKVVVPAVPTMPAMAAGGPRKGG